jgi:alpha-1,2-mannosyltransferase
MYPIYPFLALNAAIALHSILSYLGSTNPRRLVSKIPSKIKLAIVSVGVVLAVNAGISRTYGLVAAYSAPMA